MVRGARAGRHACEDLTKDPPPGVGPYKITESVPNRQFVLEKNENFPDLGPDIPAGKLDKITTKIIKSAQRQAQDVISGELDYMQDPPPADIKPEVKAKYSDRYEEHTAASTYYFFMNTRVPPFDDPKVREAVNWGVDKPALARIFAGEVAPGLLVPAARHAGLRRGARRRGLPVGQPERAAGPREGAADDQGRRRGGRRR